MTLKDKFNPYCDNLFLSKEVNSESCVEIAEYFAIEFAEWCNELRVNGTGYYENSTKQLLEIFKKEKNYETKNKFK